MDAVFTMCPKFCSTMRGTNVEQPWITPKRFTPSTQSQSSGGAVATVPPATPALLQTMCTAPNSSSVRSASACTSPGAETSVGTPITWAPSAARSATVAASTGSSMSASTSWTPSAASRWAMARPMPLAPPVITATRPAKSCIGPARSDLLFGQRGHVVGIDFAGLHRVERTAVDACPLPAGALGCLLLLAGSFFLQLVESGARPSGHDVSSDCGLYQSYRRSVRVPGMASPDPQARGVDDGCDRPLGPAGRRSGAD